MTQELEITPEMIEEAQKRFEDTREKLTMKRIFDALASNPNKDPYFKHVYALMIGNPDKEEQVLLNLIEALSESNIRLTSLIADLTGADKSAETGRVMTHDHRVIKGQGPLRKGGTIPFPGGKQ